MAIKKTIAAGNPKRKKRPRCLRQHGLTPSAVRALWSLDRETGRTMNSLAEDLECDASYASHMVAELEHAGFAVRPRALHDGRQRAVTLTDAGVAIKLRIVSSG
jgi:DNA-binding MarR family transcriptional regulator